MCSANWQISRATIVVTLVTSAGQAKPRDQEHIFRGIHRVDMAMDPDGSRVLQSLIAYVGQQARLDSVEISNGQLGIYSMGNWAGSCRYMSAPSKQGLQDPLRGTFSVGRQRQRPGAPSGERWLHCQLHWKSTVSWQLSQR